MVTGRKPFVADSPLAVLRMHMDDAPKPPSQVVPNCCSPEMERVILRALAKEPGARWQTAGEMAQAVAGTPEGRETGGDDCFASRAPSMAAVGGGGAAAACGASSRTAARVALAVAVVVAIGDDVVAAVEAIAAEGEAKASMTR